MQIQYGWFVFGLKTFFGSHASRTDVVLRKIQVAWERRGFQPQRCDVTSALRAEDAAPAETEPSELLHSGLQKSPSLEILN